MQLKPLVFLLFYFFTDLLCVIWCTFAAVFFYKQQQVKMNMHAVLPAHYLKKTLKATVSVKLLNIMGHLAERDRERGRERAV